MAVEARARVMLGARTVHNVQSLISGAPPAGGPQPIAVVAASIASVRPQAHRPLLSNPAGE